MALGDDRRDIPKKQPVCIIKIEIVLLFNGIFSYLCIKSQISLRAWSFSTNRSDILTSERDWALLASQVRDLCTVVFRTSRLSLTSFFKCRIFCCWPKISASDLFNFVWNETEINQEKNIYIFFVKSITLSSHVKQQVKSPTSWQNQIFYSVAYFSCLALKKIEKSN